jgi:hypothetical protein
MQKFLIALLLLAICTKIDAQVFDESGNDLSSMNGMNRQNGNFNPHNNDTTKKAKEIPKGIYVWTVDRKFGDIRPAEVDTLSHLFPQATMNTGLTGEYNTTGNNYTPRLSRIFINRPTGNEFPLTDSWSYVRRNPDEVHFTNTLSPITNLWYDNCGDKTNGEDHLNVKFATNAGKRIGLGLDVNYAYARGYFQNQSTSHFMSNFYVSYLGDHYQAHFIFSTNHQNGGITNDDYITHPEQQEQSYSENEIPTVLTSHWNRNHNNHLFLTHRYCVGFYRDVKMTEAELKAREFAQQSKKEHDSKEGADKENSFKGRPDNGASVPLGRPSDAKIAGDEPTPSIKDSLATDTTRISVTSKEMADSLLAEEAHKDSLAAMMKKEFVPVTSFIHTVEFSNYKHDYLAYQAPDKYFANTYFNIYNGKGYSNDSIFDNMRYTNLKNTLAIGLLEGFNKWAQAGLKVFATHQLRRYEQLSLAADSSAILKKTTENNVSFGGKLSKTQGRTLHYQLMGEFWTAGEDAGQLKVDFSTDLNFPLFGDTMRLAANAYFYRLHPDFFFRHYHSKHIWWDNDLEKTTRTRIEGIFNYAKTGTRLRIGVEELQNYVYLGMGYDYTNTARTALSVQVMQQSSNINVLTAQLDQPLALGPLHWDNTVTYQSSSSKEALPLPTINVFSNLYLKFRYAGVLSVELGAAATYFTKYEAPDYVPMLNQFAIQQTEASRVELGNHPFVDVYANLHLKHARFFVMMSNVLGKSAERMSFLAPHYPMNNSVLHLGVSWNFFN